MEKPNRMDRNEFYDRQDVRVAVYFPVRWRKTEDPENLAEEIRNHRTSDRFTTPPTAFSDLPSDLADLTEFQEMSPHIYSMWMSMERKMDHIIRLLSQKVFDDPRFELGYCLNLSAGGALLRLASELKPGDILQARFTPPTFPLYIAEAVSSVKSVEPDKEREGQWLVNISFDTINKNDKEDLVSYIFKRQREILRDKAD